MKNTLPEPQIDDFGKFYESLPDAFRPATIDDFHVQGKVKSGMIYLVLWNDEIRYSYQQVNPNLKGHKIKPFIDANKVFVPKAQ